MGIEQGAWPDRRLYPFPTRRVVVEGAAMSFAEMGSGPGVVLVHGTPSWDDDPGMQRKAKVAGSWLGRWMYRALNASPRFLLPMGYANRTRLTPEVHRQYLDAFPDPDSRERVLFSLARSMLESRGYLASLWDRRSGLVGVPMTLMWGMKDPAFGPTVLRRWRDAFPAASVREFADAGHWPHEEEPVAFADALKKAVQP
jgi:haloalkane dehalogenase